MEGIAPKAHRIAVLTGGRGRGSNLRAIHQHFKELGFPASVALVIGDRRQTPVCELCQELKLPFVYVSSKDMQSYEAEVIKLINEHQIELIALAGFLKLLSADFLSRVQVPVLNIHPSLLPKYGGDKMYGMRVHEAVLAAGDKESGATVHEVSPIYDAGRIIKQKSVDISDCINSEEIAQKVLKIEHQIYAEAILQYLKS
ncbi:MAG: phosphoribosylglycinamide formyltransferase [Candidatus Cloacimonadaceae bacterium]|jgi:phosphoribosylglycinamide formyltransferase-1